MILYLIRHGSTQGNEQRLYYGSTDLPLTAQGAEGILALKEHGLYPPASGLRLYHTGLRRTQQTLALIYGELDAVALPAFQEMRFGAFEMRSHRQLELEPAYQDWILDQSGEVACPSGESAAGFGSRVKEAFELLKQRGESALLCCHGGVIGVLMDWLFPEAGRHFYQWQPKVGEGYELRFEQGSPTLWRPLSLEAQGQ